MRPVPLPALLTLAVFTSAQAAPVVEAEPSRLVLGPRARAEITVRNPGPGLHAAVSMGTLTAGTSGGDFTRFLWAPPVDARAPTLVLFAFWSGDAPSLSEVTVLSLPCAGRTELAIETEPSAQVTVEVAGARFGPRRADRQGRLKMPVEVGPNAHEARVIAELSDQSKIRVLPLNLPPSPWLLALDPESSVEGAPVHALVVVPDTEESAGTELVAEGAKVEREQEAGRRLLLRVVPERSRSSVALVARTLDGSVRAQATLEVVRAVAPAPVDTPPPPPPSGRWVLGGAVGGYVGGGSNAGPQGALTVGYGLSHLPLVMELEIGVRAQSMSAQVGTLGVQKSTLLVFPIELAVRWEALAAGSFRLAFRGGGGLLVASHHLSSTFDAELSEAALGWELFAAGQAGLQVGPVEPYLEVRPALSKVSTDHLEARPGGGVFSVGVRGELR
ncbi:MAG TPA: hypothetical protein VMT11_05745 [Myxococcaceae bacterium]|nr:hypothetical protein [Myxococcaceae bacterium]